MPDILETLYAKLANNLSLYMHKEEDLFLVRKAFLYSKKKHENQFRQSGEPYAVHPLNVAIILSELHVMPNTIVAGLLHDVVEDTDSTLEEVEEMFGSDVKTLVDGVTKVTELDFVSLEKSQAENHQKMIIAMAKDIRVIVVKLADRLHNMRTLEFKSPEKQVRISNETLEIYAPLAHKIGMFNIKAELEDLALKYVDKPAYESITQLIDTKLSSSDSHIEKMIKEVSELLTICGLKDFYIKGRIKSKYSIYKKMVNQHKDFDDIYDFLAIRVIVDRVEECYQVLGIIHSKYTPIPMRFKDYISVPKPNMYQSLHTTVIGVDEDTFEIQIRTKDMDSVAEYGIAAHWAYKENVEYSKEREQYEIAQKLKWYADLLMLTDEEKTEDAKDLVDAVKGDILDANVYVYTPKGEVVALPHGSTPLDFAYKIHTNIGNQTVGAIVNNHIVPLSYELKNGDIVSMKINKNSSGPSEDWLKICKTSHAKQKIKNFLNKQNHDILSESGKTDIEREMAFSRCTVPLTDDFCKEAFGRNGIDSIEDLYIDVGKGLISAKSVVTKLLGLQPVDAQFVLQRQMERSNRILTTHSDTGVIVEGLTNPKIKLASCCCPLPGDDIVGFISKANGIVVHTAECKNYETLDQNRTISLYWAANITRRYPVLLRIKASESRNVVADIIALLNSYNVGILSLNNNTTIEHGTIIKLKVLANSKMEIDTVLSNIKKITNVYEATRI